MRASTASARALRDLLILLIALSALLALAGALGLGEGLHAWSRQQDFGGIGDLALSGVLVSLPLGWFAYRRWGDARREHARTLHLKAELARVTASRRQSEAQLHTETERFSAAAKSAKLGYFVWDLEENRCVYCSEEYARLHGLTVAEYMKKSANLDKDSLLVHPDDREYYRRSIDNSNEGQRPLDIEYRIITKSGVVRHIREIEHKFVVENGRPLRTEGTLQDITDLKRSETLLLHALNASTHTVALYDAQDRLVMANPAYKALFARAGVFVERGDHYQALLDRAVAQYGMDKTPQRIRTWFSDRIDRRRSPARGVEFPTLDGAWMEANDIILDDGSVLTMASDITERKALEERMRQAQRLEAVGQLTAGLAHDFNNLLGIIQGNAELLAEQNAADPNLASAILTASRRGAELTHRLLAFSRKQPLRPRAADLEGLIGTMMPQLKRTMGDAVEIRCRFAADLWPVRVDPGALGNALVNLARNARRAMPDGGTLTITCSNLERDQRGVGGEDSDQDCLSIEIADSGIGMGPEVLSRAFEPFFTTDETTQSSGLGLSMVYGFAEQSGGRVTLDSAPGRGTRALLTLPRARGATPSEAAPASAEVRGLPQGKDELVLLLDDSRPIRAMVQAQLNRMGYRTREAASADEALRILSQERVALALVDIMLADGLSGPAFVARAKQAHPELKVIFMSGYSAETAALDPGSRLLTKPFRRHELARALRAALD